MELPTPDEEWQTDTLQLLDTHDIPYITWTDQKTVEDLIGEVQAGETVLEVNEQGELCRHVSVACVDVFSMNGQGKRVRLVEDRQEFRDNRQPRYRTGLLTSLGEKITVGADEPETPFAAAHRAVKEELGIVQVDMMAEMGVAQRQEESSSYPGLTTVYTDHYFAVEVPYNPDGYTEVQSDKTTYFRWDQAPQISEETTNETLRRVDALLVPLAINLILGREDLTEDEKRAFIRGIDDSEWHSASWHQYGILTHSEKFEESLVNEIPDFVEEWGVGDLVTNALDEKIDGVSKRSLMRVAAKVHDVGKFTARKKQGDKIRFLDHEAHSGEIVREGLAETFVDLGFTEAQIEYVARCSELHFELGKMRRTAIESGDGYTLAYVRSEAGHVAMREIIADYPDYAVEIGLMFIADSLSKTEVFATVGAEDTDETIKAQRERLVARIDELGLNPRLIDQALQMPVNLEIAKQFLLLLKSLQV